MKISNSGNQIDERAIADFESEMNVKLPIAYKIFLVSNNGGNPLPKKFTTEDGKVESMVAYFFPLDDSAEDNLQNEFEGLTLAGQIPKNLISIAQDPTENRVVMSISGEDTGKIYYWSWDEEPKKPTCSYKYLRLISNSFDDFISSLQ